MRDGVDFFIFSRDAQKLADFRLAAERGGLPWQASPQACRCYGGEAAREQAADILAGLIFGIWEWRWLAALARRRYDCFTQAELRLMLDKAACLTREDSFCWGLFAGGRRHERLRAALTEQLQRCPRLDLEGFWRFRLEGYREYLQTLLSIAADEVLCEQEDSEYLRLLTGFMELRPPGEEIHVFLLRQGRYDICLQTTGGLRFLEGGRLQGCEDMLLSALLQLAPRRLYVHTDQPLPKALQQTLQDMFGARLRWESVACGQGVNSSE